MVSPFLPLRSNSYNKWDSWEYIYGVFKELW
jgi:hypothetical protein